MPLRNPLTRMIAGIIEIKRDEFILFPLKDASRS